jgi:S1-C subfamily serine protease
MRKSFLSIWLVILVFTCFSTAKAKSDCTIPIPDLFSQVSPAVVSISGISINPLSARNKFSVSTGSGIIMNAEGIVLTNSHVVYGRRAIMVTLDDGHTVPAKLLGADPVLDLAVLSIPIPPAGLPTVTLGDSNLLRVGEEVIAIGNPFGLDQTLTRGVVSGINRVLPVSPMSRMLPLIQTDAAINPGNSGGPLLDRCGKVVGINSSILAEAENIAFAVPINIAKRVVPQLIEKGRIIRPWLGITGELIKADELGQLFNFPFVDGFLVEMVISGSPAEKAGLRGGWLPIKVAGDEYLFGGDIITAANGVALYSDQKLENFVASIKVGDTVRLDLFRNGKRLKVEFSIIERPVLPGDVAVPD